MNMNLQQIKQTLRAHPGGYAWPGGYPLYWVTADGGALAWEVVRAQWCEIVQAHLHKDRRCGWYVEACDVNWEDTDLYCDHTGARIESAYGED
jgi:hypothetical protein